MESLKITLPSKNQILQFISSAYEIAKPAVVENGRKLYQMGSPVAAPVALFSARIATVATVSAIITRLYFSLLIHGPKDEESKKRWKEGKEENFHHKAALFGAFTGLAVYSRAFPPLSAVTHHFPTWAAWLAGGAAMAVFSYYSVRFVAGPQKETLQDENGNRITYIYYTAENAMPIGLLTGVAISVIFSSNFQSHHIFSDLPKIQSAAKAVGAFFLP